MVRRLLVVRRRGAGRGGARRAAAGGATARTRARAAARATRPCAGWRGGRPAWSTAGAAPRSAASRWGRRGWRHVGQRRRRRNQQCAGHERNRQMFQSPHTSYASVPRSPGRRCV